jgi:hypothetical protein
MPAGSWACDARVLCLPLHVSERSENRHTHQRIANQHPEGNRRQRVDCQRRGRRARRSSALCRALPHTDTKRCKRTSPYPLTDRDPNAAGNALTDTRANRPGNTDHYPYRHPYENSFAYCDLHRTPNTNKYPFADPNENSNLYTDCDANQDRDADKYRNADKHRDANENGDADENSDLDANPHTDTI